MFNCFTTTDTGNSDHPDKYLDKIIIHIHGGGFVAMSSFSHQSYTRQWANTVRKPIFSIDYRLAPKDPYPAALDDCWQVYNWIIDNVQNELGVKTTKVILVGDSAGGNLALAVALRAIKTGIRVPDGLLLAYPALNLHQRRFNPSIMLAIDDLIVPYSFLKLCLEAYIPEGAFPEKDPFLSPILASEELLSKLPKTRIMVGNKDPLHDEAWRLTDKMRKLGRDIRMVVYKDMPHGFLGYDTPNGGMKEARECIRDGAAILLELLGE